VPLVFGLMLLVLAIAWLAYPFVTPLTPKTTIAGPLSQQTEFAQSSWGVYALVYWITLVVFVLVEGFLVWVLFRFQGTRDELPEQVHGNTPLEIGWTAVTLVLVMVMFVPSCRQVAFVQGPPQVKPAGAEALQIKVDARQWWWEYYYPEYDIVTANELVLPAGRTVVFDVGSTDVIHSFWLPRLGGKRDAVPGRRQRLWFTPTETGVYDGQCAEFCGTSHARMAMQTFVVPPAEFDAWVAQQKAPTDPAAMPGFGTFAAAGCIACHNTMQNDRAVFGQLGPNLRKVGTRRMIAAGTLENTPENLRAWISNPQSIKPGALMDIPAAQCTGQGEPEACCRKPGVGNCLDEATLSSLVAYLQQLD
jgi:cytochrome c oxidase subunit 2